MLRTTFILEIFGEEHDRDFLAQVHPVLMPTVKVYGLSAKASTVDTAACTFFRTLYFSLVLQQYARNVLKVAKGLIVVSTS